MVTTHPLQWLLDWQLAVFNATAQAMHDAGRIAYTDNVIAIDFKAGARK